jgi:hypothetical protein
MLATTLSMISVQIAVSTTATTSSPFIDISGSFHLRGFARSVSKVFAVHQGSAKCDVVHFRRKAMESEMALKRIRLELARTEGFPNGSPDHGYEFVAPLTTDGHLSAEEWRTQKDKCTVRRFWRGQPDEFGKLRHLGHGWRFDYDPSDADDDEPFFKLDRHALVEGAYVSVTEHDHIQRPFKIAGVARFA